MTAPLPAFLRTDPPEAHCRAPGRRCHRITPESVNGPGEGPRGNLARQTALVLRPGCFGGLAVKDMLYWSLAVPATVVVALILLRLMRAPI